MSVIACERECGPSLCYMSVCVVWQTDGFTPLYIASQNGQVEAVRALVGAGAAVNQADVREDLVFGCASVCGVWIAACSCSFVCVMCA
jgi:ankyrin repeat protein